MLSFILVFAVYAEGDLSAIDDKLGFLQDQIKAKKWTEGAFTAEKILNNPDYVLDTADGKKKAKQIVKSLIALSDLP